MPVLLPGGVAVQHQVLAGSGGAGLSRPAIGAPTLTETGIVLEARLGPAARGLLERFLDEVGMQEVPFGELHWREAVDAYRRYGKGRHPASLNFGDCMTYAVAALAGEPLLFVGDDFVHTELTPARSASE